ncbi:ABC transporter permease [Faecalimonas sp.]
MNGMKEIFKKEIVRVFKDKKMVFSVFVLPIVAMLGVLYLMGNVMSNMHDDIEAHQSKVYIQNEPAGFETFCKTTKLDMQIEDADKTTEKGIKQELKDGKADLYMVFPEKFEEHIQNYKVGDKVPEITVYHNPSEEYSQAAYNKIGVQAIEAYRQTLLKVRIGDMSRISIFTVNADTEETIIQDDNKASGKALGTMLPYLLTLLLFAGAMSIGTDMIAGEKERGTMASLLVTPIKRSSIIFGKVFALMVISGISAVVSVVGMVVGMPVIQEQMMGGVEQGMSMKWSVQQIIMLAVLIIALSFLYATIIALVSVFAKTIKEANSFVMPVYMIVLVVGLLTMYTTKEPTTFSYFIPFYNSAIALQGILMQEVSMAQYVITLFITLGGGILLTGIIAKAFESEKVMSS